jgi:hypothetical protein
LQTAALRGYAGRCDEEPFAVPRPLRLAQVFERDAALAGWSQRHREEARLTAAVRAQLPRPLAPQVRVAASDSKSIELAAGAGAVAAILRQRAPDLLAALRREGWDFTELRVRVQVRGLVVSPVKTSENQRDATGARPLFELSERLSDGPLRAALTRWSRRARGRS